MRCDNCGAASKAALCLDCGVDAVLGIVRPGTKAEVLLRYPHLLDEATRRFERNPRLFQLYLVLDPSFAGEPQLWSATDRTTILRVYANLDQERTVRQALAHLREKFNNSREIVTVYRTDVLPSQEEAKDAIQAG